MRLSSLFIRLAVFAAAAVGSFVGGKSAVAVVEDVSVIAVQGELLDIGHDWASVLGDGLQVIIEGEAPSEASRFRSISVAGGVVDASRIIDNMSVTDADGIAPPNFAIEILRNDKGVSLIGLVPVSTGHDDLSDRIARIADGAPVADFLEEADYPVPEDWRPALNFALRVLADLPRSKISVSAGQVDITAIAEGAGHKRELEADLTRQRPSDVTLNLLITAPRPVITPYITRFRLGEDGAAFDSCTADTVETRDMILQAAADAGMEGTANCTLALGVPSGTWGDAVSLSINALSELGSGTLTISDADIALVATMGTDADLFDRVIGDLDSTLPELFALEASLPQPPDENEAEIPQFVATLSPEGQAQLRGKVTDDLMTMTTENFAQAKFGRGAVIMGTRVTEGLPKGWSVRVLAGLQALSHLSNGSVTVEPDTITVRGDTGNVESSAEISRLLIEKLGEAAVFDVDVTYFERLDPIAALPTAEECIDSVVAVTVDQKILFDPGSASITADTQPVIDQIAEMLKECTEIPMEIAGYTDSQGREEMNLSLSKNRAEAVLTALRARRIPTGSFSANGYGEADPIADNETEEGREANRRIEFRLITEEVPEAVIAPEIAEENAPAPTEAPATEQQDGTQ